MAFFTDTGEKIQENLYGAQKILNSQSNFRKNKVGGIILPDVRIILQSYNNQALWYWHKNKHLEQWNEIEKPK